MTIKIDGKEIELRYSMRMYILYENITGKSLNFEEMTSYTTVMTLLYCAILGTMQKNKQELTLTYNEFLDWIDDNGMDIIPEFAKWFLHQIEISSGVGKLEKPKDDEKDEKKEENVDPNS